MINNKLWGKWSRLAATVLLGATALFGGTDLTVRAEQAQAQTPAPIISNWSVPTLHEGEKYGIFPISWYYDGIFQQPIDQAKLSMLLEGTAAKLDQLGYNKKDSTMPLVAVDSKVITRDTVLQSLHGLLARYELPKAFGLDSVAPVDYLQQKGIVTGTKSGLELDRPCTVEQATVLASRLVEFSYDTAEQGAKGVFWKVTHNDNTMYLLGSIHLGISEMYPLEKKVRDAFDAADDLWVEVDTLSSDMSYLIEQMSYTDGTKLQDHISKETYEKLQKVLAKMEMPEQTFDSSKPIAVTTNLSTLALFEQPEQIAMASLTGIDQYFLTKAKLTGKPIHELESVELQSDVFTSVSPEAQEEGLNAMLDQLLGDGNKEIAKAFKQMQLDWAKGDKDAVGEWLTQGLTEGEFNSNLVGERDTNMAKKLAEVLEQDGKRTSFVVVGSAHYVMKGMVIDQLKEKGYDVQLVK
ncbi:TraB/GumN family protein [Paenibacillus aceti]|uniref:Polysaccharide biosynthesis protein GumN n=1 Tax=Paenibacillus aceti TaxID=1820010 RepID=A0ABQ1VUB9_9BACL|nr:TraB/GumN family protein [Paenibacillus aceti]GGF99448.1 hypothetical protein GCM10010913_21560 [Paenibacillus aceti]